MAAPAAVVAHWKRAVDVTHWTRAAVAAWCGGLAGGVGGVELTAASTRPSYCIISISVSEIACALRAIAASARLARCCAYATVCITTLTVWVVQAG